MEHTARRFARRVLALHLLALVLIGILVTFAAIEVYQGARQHALVQARKRQELLAVQTARGIESYYASILDNLDLQRRAEEDEPESEGPAPASTQRAGSLSPQFIQRLRSAQGLLGPLMWDQLRGRASHFFSLDRRTMKPAHDFTDDGTTTAEEIVASGADWIKKLARPEISDAITVNGRQMTLVAVPLRGGASSRALIASVPLDNVERLFLADVNKQHLMSAWLADESSRVMLSYDPRLINLKFNENVDDPACRAMVERFIRADQGGTEILDHPVRVGPLKLDSAMVTVQPVRVSGGKWLLAIASGLQDVNAVVKQTFSRAIMWAIFVVLSTTAVFISSSIFLIRSRLKLERARHELLTAELDQAREIQLAWLPDPRRQRVSIDVAASNVPASHISGDFYNWFELPDKRTVVLIGDVTGHGMAAAFLMATTQLLIRTTMGNCGSAGECLEKVNRQLCSQPFNGQFVTMLILVLDANRRAVEIASAGHPPPLICEAGVLRDVRIEPQLVLGVESDTEYQSQTLPLDHHPTILMYTDGVCDAVSEADERFGLARLRTLLLAECKSAQRLLESVLQSVHAFRQQRELGDDLTLVAVQMSEVKRSERVDVVVGTTAGST